jgi:hypothetical protein
MKLWVEDSHTSRDPIEVPMHHMRVRANLTPEEHKEILEFLKSRT